MIDLHIRQPEFGAGTTYGWDVPKYGIRGIGIAKFRLRGKDHMTIKVRDEVYRVPTAKVKEFMKEHSESKHIAKGTELCVIPISIMTWIRTEYVPRKQEENKPKEKENLQQSLFDA